MEDVMNNSEEIDDQMSDIIDDIKYSRYEDAEVNETDWIINGTYIVEYTSQKHKRSTREKAGKGIARLEPMFKGKAYDSILRKVKFLMTKTKNEMK